MTIRGNGGSRKGGSRVVSAVVAATSLVVLLGAARRFDPLPEGLRGTYFSTPDWSLSPIHSTVDLQPSTASVVAAFNGSPPQAFSATWSGSFIALRDGTYTLATASDDGSWVDVDGRLVVDNGGRHGTQVATGSVHLAPGAHTISINYFQDGGSLHFELLWSRGGARLEVMPSWALAPARPTFLRFLASVILRRSLPAAEWLWVATLVVGLGAAAWPSVANMGAVLRREAAWRAVMTVIAASLVLNVTGIWWGLPGRVSWVGDEITPRDVLIGLSQHFSRGWFDKYPPAQYYVLTAVFAPLLFLERLGRIDLSSDLWYAALFLASRLVSVAAGAATLVAVYLCGARAFSTRAGLFAAASLAVVAPFVCYSKMANVDVPYLFWFALSLVFYVRLLGPPAAARAVRPGTPALRDFVLFAASATLAVCTKDQAYGLYLAAPFVIVFAIWRANRATGVPRPLARAVVDARLGLAAATAAILFIVCHDLIFNAGGFIDHVRYITSSGSTRYRVFEPTFVGRLQLLALTVHLDRISWGWPLWLVSLAGFARAIASPETRRVAVALALLAISYYLGFINVILYNYDRFLLPVCALQALFAGVALDRFLAAANARLKWRTVVVGGMFAYTLLYAGTVDVLMLRDSRYFVEEWLRSHVGRDELIGTVFPLKNLPRLDGFQSVDIGTIETLRRFAPAFYVLNADYARAEPPATPTGQLIAGLQHQTLGYTLAFRYRSPAPWPWLLGAHQDLVGPRLEPQVFSTLQDINPTLEVYQRVRGKQTVGG